MKPLVVLLLGFPGSGKYTVGSEVVGQLQDRGDEARLVDNHYVNNVIFNLVAQDGVTPLPPPVWERVAEVRAAVVRTVEELSPASWSFVFTYAPEDTAEDRALVARIAGLAGARGARFVPVRLVCDPAELERRIVRPERREMMKSRSVEDLRRLQAAGPLLDPGFVDTLTLDTTSLPPPAAARAVLEHAGR